MKKMFVAFVALLVSTVAFSLPTPPDDNDPMAEALKQYAAQVDELNKKLEQTILPPLKEVLQVAKDSRSQDFLTPEQEQSLDKSQSQLMEALTSIVTPIVAEVNMDELNAQLKQFSAITGQAAQEISKEDFTNLMLGMTLLQAINHFAQNNLITQEDVEILGALFFSPEEKDQ